MLRADPKSLSDEDLIHAAASTSVEDALAAGGCLGSIAVVLLLFVGQLVFGSAALPFVIGVALIVAVVALAYRVVSWPKRRLREELRYRCGEAQFARYLEESEAALARGEADWIIFLTIAHLPH